MQTSFSSDFIKSKDGERVNEILRNCVHCGFCNATCPTYQLTGDELDGPRGRIYLIKNFFEDQSKEDDESSSNYNVGLKHIDRCLTCLSCETTCPSGVKYGELVDIGRKHINSSVKRSFLDKIKRKLIIQWLSSPKKSSFVFALARIAKPFMPIRLAQKIPANTKLKNDQKSTCINPKKRTLTIKGCVQAVAAPQINQAAKIALANSEIQCDDSRSECCGALAFHLTDLNKAYATIRKNIDEWYVKLNDDYEYLVITSSGCSNFIKQYITIMQDDSNYADKAKFISEHCLDLAELAPELNLSKADAENKLIAFHSPCTLQHGQNIKDGIENKLVEAGYHLTGVQNSHICCGSAGSYSLLEPELSAQLLKNKVAELESNQPDMIVTANIGCLMHLQSASRVPVKHWAELLD